MALLTRLIFWRKHDAIKKAELDAIEKRAERTHQQNISRIVQSREKAVKLKKVLEQNNITIELAKAVGH